MKIASGKVSARDGEIPFDETSLSELVAAANSQEVIKQTGDALKASAELAASLGKRFAELLERPIAMGALVSELNELAEQCAKYSGVAGSAPPTDAEGPFSPSDGNAVAPDASSPVPVQTQAIGAVNSDEEANSLLEEVLAYYASSAPSSPVALILLQVHELRNASFLDWVKATGKGGPDNAALDLDGIDVTRLAEFGGDAPAQPEGPDTSSIDSDLFNRYDDVRKALKMLRQAAEKETPEGEEPKPLDFEPISERIESLIVTIDTARELLTSQPTPVARAPVVTGRIKSRRDVKEALESLAMYHQTLDPASPVQTILRRTKSLVDMEYMDILSELSPKGGNLALKMVKPEPKT
jgi:predicted component of type VI protein secretion system